MKAPKNVQATFDDTGSSVEIEGVVYRKQVNLKAGTYLRCRTRTSMFMQEGDVVLVARGRAVCVHSEINEQTMVDTFGRTVELQDLINDIANWEELDDKKVWK